MAGLVALMATSPPAVGQVVLPVTSDFNDGTPQGWTSQGTSKFFVPPNQFGPAGSPGDLFVRVEDASSSVTTAVVLAPPAYLGDWSQLCRLEFDVQLLDDGVGGSQPFTPRVFIEWDDDGFNSGAPPIAQARFRATSVSLTEGSGWAHVSAPLAPLDVNGQLPGDAAGVWEMTIGTNDDWNDLLAHVGVLRLPAEFTAGKEVFGFDNVQLSGCPCLGSLRDTLLCTPDGSGDYLWTFFFRNLSDTAVEHLFFVDLPSGVSIVREGSLQPNYVHFTPPIPKNGFRTVKLRIKNATPGTLSFRITLHDKDIEQCCVAEHTLELPECECAQIVGVKAPNCFFSPPPPYSYTLTLENLSSNLVDYLLFTPTGNPVPNVTLTPNVVSGLGLDPVPYANGEGRHSQAVTISGPDAKAGQEVCLNVSLHDELFRECCSIEQCVTLPSCILPPWEPIGTGTVVFFRDRLVISNLGSSGEDGARVDLGEAESFRLGWRDLDPSDALPQGTLLRFGSTGAVAGREQELGTIEIVKGASALELSADFSAIHSPTQRLEVYAGEELVTVVSGHQGTVTLAGNNGVVTWPAAVSKLGGDGGTTCYAPEWDEPIRITIPGTGTFVGDELRVLAETDETLDFISSFRLQAAQISKIVVVEAEAVYDCNDNGVPDAFDVTNGTSFDANFDGIPDECQASPGDLVVLLNTGFDEAADTVLSPPATDDDWTVINADPPRRGRIVANPVAAWAAAQPDSAWISVNRNRGQSVPGLERPQFETCFCLGEGASAAALDLELFADDRATVFLNGGHVAGPDGGFNTPEPFSVHYSETVGEGLLRTGENCLQVEVDDFGGVFTGLNLVGTLRVGNGACE